MLNFKFFSLVWKFSNQFDFCFNSSQIISVMNLKQRKIKIILVWWFCCNISTQYLELSSLNDFNKLNFLQAKRLSDDNS